MAGTTTTLIPSTSKRKRDSNLASPGKEIEVEPELDLRQQICKTCTLAWPWVIFQRNADETRNLEEEVCYSCLGIMEQQWELNYVQMNDQIAKAKKKLLHVGVGTSTLPPSITNTTTPPVASTRVPAPTTNSTGQYRQPVPLAPATAPNQSVDQNQNQNQGQGRAQTQTQTAEQASGSAWTQAQSQASTRVQYQTQAQAQAELRAHAHAQAQAQVQAQAQAQAFTGYNGHHQPPLPPYNPVQYQQQVNHQPNPYYGYTQAPPQQPIYPWHPLYSLPEPTRAMRWLTSNYQPVSRATPITQLEFYQHYHASIPPVGYPPLMDGKGFIMLAARHFAGSGVTLNKTNFTIDGLWRRVHPLPV